MCHIGLSHPNGLRKYTESFKHISRAMSVLDVGNNLNNQGKDAKDHIEIVCQTKKMQGSLQVQNQDGLDALQD